MRATATSLVAALMAVTVIAASGVAVAGPSQATSPSAEPSYAMPSGDPGTDGAGPATGAAAPADACAPLSNGSGRPDPGSDELGWERGCWHDASLRLDHADGLNATEIDAVLARAMARVEVVRRLEFERTPELEVISRQQYAERMAEGLSATGATRLRKNAKWEALMMVGEDADAVDVLQSNAAGSGGYYSPTEGRVVVVADDPEHPRIDELLLAHELVHPLQVQQFDAADRFDLSTFEQHRTTESVNAINSLVEGEAVLVRMRYQDRCGAAWSCLRASTAGVAPDPHRGLLLVNSYPYFDGPKFVHEVRQAGGWDAVNDLYEHPPASTEQVMNPASYPGEEPTAVEFTDASRDGWRIPEVDTGQPEYVSVGAPGITSMFLYTVFDTNRRQPSVLPVRVFYNDTGDGLDRFDPYRYGNNPYASGWEGDRLYPYVKGNSTGAATTESTAAVETGYVWKIAFETANDSREFVEGYDELLAYYNATPVEDRRNTYRIPDGDAFGDAFYVNRTGSTVVVVNAPSVEELRAVRTGAAPRTGRSLALPGPLAESPAWLVGVAAVLVVAIAGILGRALRERRD